MVRGAQHRKGSGPAVVARELAALVPLAVRHCVPREQFFQRSKARRVDQAQQAHLQMYARVGFAAEVIVGLQQDLKKSRQILFAELGRCALQGGTLIGRRGNQVRVCAANPRNQQVAHVPNGFAQKCCKFRPSF